MRDYYSIASREDKAYHDSSTVTESEHHWKMYLAEYPVLHEADFHYDHLVHTSPQFHKNSEVSVIIQPPSSVFPYTVHVTSYLNFSTEIRSLASRNSVNVREIFRRASASAINVSSDLQMQNVVTLLHKQTLWWATLPDALLPTRVVWNMFGAKSKTWWRCT